MKRFILTLCVMLLLLTGCKEQGSSDSSSRYNPYWDSPPERPWVAVTPAGIQLITDLSTIDQYEARWGGVFHWENIDWETLDKEFEFYKQYYCYQLNWDCKNANTSQLTVYIKPWDNRCQDAESPCQPKEIYVYINGEWQCIDGWYWEQVIYFHLGDDPGQDHTTIFTEDGLTTADYGAFQESAYSHELLHFFQQMAGLPFSEDVYYPPRIAYILHLPDEETEGEEDKDL